MNFNANKFVNKHGPLIKSQLTKELLLEDLIEIYIKPMLIDLGYESTWFSELSKESEGIIQLNITATKNEKLAVLVNSNIEENIMDNLMKALSFLGRENYTWVIFTNGMQWLLLNKDIKTKGNRHIQGESVVAHVEIDHPFRGEQSPEWFKLFTHEWLLTQYGSTIYYRDLQQFKVYQYNGNESSWRQYKQGVTLLIRYVTSLKKRGKGYYRITDGHEFINIMKWAASQDTHRSKGNRQLSITYIRNVYRWLNSFFKVMAMVGFYKYNPLKEITVNEALQGLANIIAPKKKKDDVDLNKLVNSVLNLMEQERNSERNQLAFLLLLYGLDREEITSLKWKNYNSKEQSIALSSNPFKKIDLKHTPEIISLIDQLENRIRESGIKTEWLICKSDGDKLTGEALTHYTINRKIKEASGISLTIEDIQQSIFKTTIRKSKDAFTILYLRGWDTSRLQELIDKEEIVDMADFEKMIQHHPLKEVL